MWVLYPAISPRTKTIKKKSDSLHLLFVGSPFLHKGGYETIEAFKQLKSQWPNCQLTIVTKCEIDPLFLGEPGLNVFSRVSSERLREIFQNADLMIMPQHLDTLGFVMMEAFSWGLPVVTTRNFSTPEIISDQQNGIIVDNPESFWDEHGLQRFRWWQDTTFERKLKGLAQDEKYIQSISDAILMVAKKIEFYSQNALQSVTSGPLSFEQRNKKLAEIYEGLTLS
jgi:glycosyltransferase involved in cell wall biosynthesis